MTLIIEWLLEGLALAAIATFAVSLVPASSAAQRHLVWWLALLSVLALPWTPNLFTSSAVASVQALGWPAATKGSLVEVPALPSWTLMLVLAVWAFAALVSLVRLAINLRATCRLADFATPLDPARTARFHQFTAARQSSRDAHICVSADIRGACAIGFLRPRILLSSDLVATLDDEAIESIVLHEYAHLQRFDDWTRLAQCAVLTIAGLHPAVWWISRRMDAEREIACDRLVVQRTGSPIAYARALARAAEIASRMSGLTPIAVPGASMQGASLHARVSRLLAWRIESPRAAWSGSMAGAASLALGVALTGAMPPLVVIASIQKPLLALASMPLGFGVVGALPEGVGAALPLGISAAQGGSDIGPAPAVVVPAPVEVASDRGRVEVLSEPSRVPTVAAATVPVDATPAASPGGDVAVVLASTSLAPVAGALVPAPEVAVSRATGIGSSASRIGVATADVASRAGMSVGRFFRDGGLALAKSF